MPTTLPLPLLIELAQNRADEAAKKLGQLQQAQLSAAQKLQILQQYRTEYLEQLQHRIHQGLPLSQLRNYQVFVHTLDGAIEQQRAVTLHAEKRLAKGRSDWQGEQRQRNAYDTLALRARQEAELAAGRREQKMSDERTSRLQPSALAPSLAA